MDNRIKSFMGMGFTAIVWTGGFMQIKKILESVGPFTFIFIRFLIALIALIIFQKIYGIKEKIDVKDRLRVFINALIGSLIYFVIAALTIIHLPAVDSAALSSMQLILMLWAESMVCENIVTPRRVFYVVIATIGGILLMRAVSMSIGSIIAYLSMFIATCFWVAYYIIQMPLLQKYKVTTVIKYQSLFAVIATFPLIFLDNNKLYLIEGTHIISFLYLGVFGIACGYSFNSYALKNIGATNTSLLLIFQPIIILFSDFLIYRRGFTLSDYTGLLFIIIGMILMVIELRKNKCILQKEEP